jgi:hypothetical protein
MSFFVRINKPEDWQNHLALPERQWKRGYSGRALAYCWMEAKGFPSSVKEAFQKSEHAVFRNADFLAGFVEHKVPLLGGGHPSQNDLVILAKSKNDLIAIAVEGKVSERVAKPFFFFNYHGLPSLRGKDYSPLIYGKAVLNRRLLRVYRFWRSKHYAVGLN